VKQAVDLAQGRFEEVMGIETSPRRWGREPRPVMVLTLISLAKNLLPRASTERRWPSAPSRR